MLTETNRRAALLLSVVVAIGQGACGGSTEDESVRDAGTGGGAQGGTGAQGGASGSGGTGATSGSGGSAATSGSGGIAGSAAVAGTGGTACGESGGACAPEGVTCDPDPECCGCTYVCRSGHWEVGLCPPCAAPPPCPESPPMNGAACDVCTQGPCIYDTCPTDTRQVATCDAGRWTVSSTSCPQRCGYTDASAPCAAGQVCVIPGALGPQPTCQDNPCGSAPLSCECAGSLCDVGYCDSAVNDFVYCVCPNC